MIYSDPSKFYTVFLHLFAIETVVSLIYCQNKRQYLPLCHVGHRVEKVVHFLGNQLNSFLEKTDLRDNR